MSGIRVIDGTRQIQITAPISHGSSGGPLVTDRAQVVGITSSTVTSGKNLNFAVPIAYLKDLLYDPELQQTYETLVELDGFYPSRSNRALIDKIRTLIVNGIIHEVPGGISTWHSRYDPFDPQAQAA